MIFSMLLFISSIFIVGFYNITRHYVVIQPDGKQIIEGDILNIWSYIIESISSTEKIYYSGETLEYKFYELQRLYPNIANKLSLSNELTSLVSVESTTLTADDIFKIELVLQVSIEFKQPDIYFLLIEEPIYTFPKWIRNPLSQCPKCMASFFGSLIWVSANHLNHNLFNWTNNKYQGFFLFWVIFIISLSWINNYIHKNLGS